MKKILLALTTAMLLISCGSKTPEITVDQLAIIPQPAKVEAQKGSFEFNSAISIVNPENELFKNEALYLQAMCKSILNKKNPISSENKGNHIEFVLDNSLASDESYKLEIKNNKITISAKASNGAFYAIQTLRQIIPADFHETVALPNLKIEDTPAFGWRGMHLDVSRHFFSMDYLKKHIDRLAFYKFNKFHLHLTDDEGWRIEIKQYPELTSKGAFRTLDNRNDKYCINKAQENPNFEIDPRFIKEENGVKTYGGYYTQEEMKDLIAYAQERHIEIIPEIDMPGHMMAAIASYPYLVDGKAGWGKIFSTPICPCKDEVYTFTKNVLSEIADLFPSKYIHIGADEVDKKSWKESALCKEYMKKHNIESVEKLQSHFVHEMQEFLKTKNKEIIAWDEILEGGTNSDVNVMYWRRWVGDAPLKSVNNGNKVIMTPSNPLYFDYPNTSSSMYDVYSMDIVFPDIPKDKEHLILGAQANVWAEIIPTENQAEFQMYPRMLALAERVWTNKNDNFDDFFQRVLKHYPRLDQMGVNYRLPDIEGFTFENVYVDSTQFMVESPLQNMNIHYTLDGSVPSISTSQLSSPISISTPTQVRMALFSPSGVRGEIYTLNFKPSNMKAAHEVSNLESGLNCSFFDGGFKGTSGIKDKKADETFVVSSIKAPKETAAFALVFDGYIDVPETGIYSFFFTCDDGGVLYIDNEMTIDNDGLHSPVMKSGQAAMTKGLHPFKLDFVEGGGGYTLRLQYSFNGSAPADIPESWFKHTKAN